MPASQLSTGITTRMPPAEPRKSKDTDTRVRDATGGHPKTRAPASFLWTVSQNQGVPTSAGHMRTAILIHPGAARRAIKFLWPGAGDASGTGGTAADDPPHQAGNVRH